jgi:DivIVA domain-containing protein
MMTGDDIRKAQFREKLRGYDAQEVDRTLARWAELLDLGEQLSAGDVQSTTFRQKLRGYHPEDVESLRTRLVEVLGG